MDTLKKKWYLVKNQKKYPIPGLGQMPQGSVVERTSDSGW